MPNLTFVLPHWLYWLGLIAVPLAAMYLIRQAGGVDQSGKTSLRVAYLLLVSCGFVGMHRFYLRNLLGFVYIPLFIAVLVFNVDARTARNDVSKAANDLSSAEFMLERAQAAVAEGQTPEQAGIAQRQTEIAAAREQMERADRNVAYWNNFASGTAALIALLMVIDAFLIPRLYRQCLEKERGRERKPPAIQVPCDVDVDGARSKDYTASIHGRFVDVVDKVNEFTGNFVAYWSVIAVFVYYYEVIARYVFNSPTNWAHESMFLMFGMQYVLAGGYVLRNNGHVRVDVIYTNFAPRLKARTDIVTSVFFFIFMITMVWTGWTFFWDAFQVREVSFTEWAIQYWPVKFALPLGSALLLLQGLAWLIKDITLLRQPKEA
jgi:TRAP-type mannitol/chloroaromatic compound transport system permease small subunit